MDFIISDSHFYHSNILKYEKRPFRNAQEMNSHMIDEWNSVVGKNDTVYHLGDIAFTNRFNILMDLLLQLNSKIKLIVGNHDHSCMKPHVPKRKWIEDKLFICDPITEAMCFADGRHEKAVLCHYPLASWNVKFHGRRHFYGHVHSDTNVMHSNAFYVTIH